MSAEVEGMSGIEGRMKDVALIETLVKNLWRGMCKYCTSCENCVAYTIQNYIPDINYPSHRNIASENQPGLPFR